MNKEQVCIQQLKCNNTEKILILKGSPFTESSSPFTESSSSSSSSNSIKINALIIINTIFILLFTTFIIIYIYNNCWNKYESKLSDIKDDQSISIQFK